MSGNVLPWSLECSLDLSGKVRHSIQLRRVGKWLCPRGGGGGLLPGEGMEGGGSKEGELMEEEPSALAKQLCPAHRSPELGMPVSRRSGVNVE